MSSVLAVAGLVQVSPLPSGRSAVRVGPSAGWLTPEGISNWESELSFIARAEMTTALARSLRATLPSEQIATKRYPLTSDAVATVPFLPLSANIAADVRNQGVRVHTVGVDRVSAGFYYFAEGGSSTPIQVQGNLVEMLAPSLAASSTNADIANLLRDLIDRLLVKLSGGAVCELDVEVANALPRLSRDGTGLAGMDLDAFEARARSLADASARWESAAERLVEALAAADASGRSSVTVPLYGEAKKETLASLDVHVGGRTLSLGVLPRWTVTGTPREEPATRAYTGSAAPVERTASIDLPAPAAVTAPREVEKAPAPGVAPASQPQKGVPTAASTPAEKPPAPVPGAPEKAATVTSPTPAVPSKPEGAPPAAAAGPVDAKPQQPEPSVVPLTPSRIVSIGAPAGRVDVPSVTASPMVSFAPETAASSNATAPVTASAASTTQAAAAASTTQAAAAASTTQAAAAASTTQAAAAASTTQAAAAASTTGVSFKSDRPFAAAGATASRPAAVETALSRAEPAGAAVPAVSPPPVSAGGHRPQTAVGGVSVAPSGRRSRISAVGLLLLLAAIAYFIGRFIRHHYLHHM